MNHCPGSGSQRQVTPVAEGRTGNKHGQISPHTAIPRCGQVVSTVHTLEQFITAAVVTRRLSIGVNAMVFRCILDNIVL